MPSGALFNVYSLVSHFGVFTLKFLLIKNFNFGKIHTYNICYLAVYSSVMLSIFTLLHSQYLELFFILQNQTRPIKQELVTPPSPLEPQTIILSVSEFD